jgi:hypothetical protein
MDAVTSLRIPVECTRPGTGKTAAGKEKRRRPSLGRTSSLKTETVGRLSRAGGRASRRGGGARETQDQARVRRLRLDARGFPSCPREGRPGLANSGSAPARDRPAPAWDLRDFARARPPPVRDRPAPAWDLRDFARARPPPVRDRCAPAWGLRDFARAVVPLAGAGLPLAWGLRDFVRAEPALQGGGPALAGARREAASRDSGFVGSGRRSARDGPERCQGSTEAAPRNTSGGLPGRGRRTRAGRRACPRGRAR